MFHAEPQEAKETCDGNLFPQSQQLNRHEWIKPPSRFGSVGNLQPLSAGLSHSFSCSPQGKGHSDLGSTTGNPNWTVPNSSVSQHGHQLPPSFSLECQSSTHCTGPGRTKNIISAWTALQEMAAPAGTGRHEGRQHTALLPLPEESVTTVVL